MQGVVAYVFPGFSSGLQSVGPLLGRLLFALFLDEIQHKGFAAHRPVVLVFSRLSRHDLVNPDIDGFLRIVDFRNEAYRPAHELFKVAPAIPRTFACGTFGHVSDVLALVAVCFPDALL